MPREPPSGENREPGEPFAVLGEIAAEIAHELGNVLQVVTGSAYVARHAALRGDAPGSLPHLEKAERGARLALSLVNDIMALARGEALCAEPVPLADVIALARRDWPSGPSAAREVARWEDEIDPPHLRVRAHPNLFARLLHALYENAVQASAPRLPLVTTRAHVTSSGAVIEVADDGPGVPADLVARAFEPLVTGRQGGSGLGLALARRIARAHGGEIVIVQGERANRFRVELPA